MRRQLSWAAVFTSVLLLASSCRSTPSREPEERVRPRKGGVLKVGYLSDFSDALDPTKNYETKGFAMLRILVRTLMSYEAAPAPVGDDPVPDLADAAPQVSDDGLTYTFAIKDGVKFAPPIDRQIVCEDFKAAVARIFDPQVVGNYSFYYTVIEGAEASKGDPEALTGVECPDDRTVVFHLTEPTGDFVYRVAMPATGPIPAAENAADGHEHDWGRFFPTTGPYMYLGEDQIDFSLPADQQKPPEGYDPNRSMTLVRNPAWDPSTDTIRPAYVDQIDVTFGGVEQDLYNKIQQGLLDDAEDAIPPAQVVQRYQADPDLKDLMYVHPFDTTFYMWMNLSVPPFDDLHVRKAVNWVVNKDAQRRIYGGPVFGEIAGHIAPPSMTGALPASFDPYATPGHRGDLNEAMAEMKQSKYDTDGDGLCDAPECKDAFFVTDQAEPYPELTTALESDLEKIGITLNVKALDLPTVGTFYGTPAKKVAMGNRGAWTKDYPDMGTFFPPLFESIGPPGGNVNWSMVRDAKVTDDVRRCQTVLDKERTDCWNAVDRYLMENVVPWVPWMWGNAVRVFSTNVASVPVPYAQFSGSTAFDAVSLTPEAIQETKSEVETSTG